ncbi:hypothetical protein [Kitasatospora sp. NPDC057223]|uniref:hypothetical protein n=1 Tax=Kitasatospora sp. NPDC057223 TaxID=3346055 RepID=UPI00362AD1C7
MYLTKTDEIRPDAEQRASAVDVLPGENGLCREDGPAAEGVPGGEAGTALEPAYESVILLSVN